MRTEDRYQRYATPSRTYVIMLPMTNEILVANGVEFRRIATDDRKWKKDKEEVAFYFHKEHLI